MRFWCLLACAVACSGCQTPVYRAASLPDQFRVASRMGVARLDLTRLAAPSEPSSRIGPGDVLKVMMATGYEDRGIESLYVRVREDGFADVPIVGAVQVAGLDPTQAEQTIAGVAVHRGVFTRPNVTVMIEEKKLNRITVVGAVTESGVVELDRSNSDLLGALAAAGGLTETAGREVQILRKSAPATHGVGPAGIVPASHSQLPPDTQMQPVAQRIDLLEASSAGLGQFQLGDGDVVHVHESPPSHAHVMGLVNEPKEIELPPDRDIRVLSAIAMAGGRTMQIANKIRVIRHLPDQAEPIVIELSYLEAKRNTGANLVLKTGDLVSVEETPTTFVVGMLQSLVRFGVSGTTPLF